MSIGIKLVIIDGVMKAIEGTYNEDTDIAAIAQKMDTVLASHQEHIHKWQQNMRKMDPLAMGYWNVWDRIARMENYIREYHHHADALVNEYDIWNLPRRKIISFKPQQEIDPAVERCRKAKLDIVVHFFALIQPLLATSAKCMSISRNLCPECGIEDSSEICVCGYIQPVKLSPPLCLATKGNYQDEENFSKMLDKHDGTISLNIKQMTRIGEKLDKYFTSYCKPTGAMVRAMPINKYGWKDGTSYKLLEEGLRHIGETCYEYITSLAAFYWGYDLPDIAVYKEGAIHDYELTQPVFLEIIQIFPHLRKSSPNTGFRKFKHLEAQGYKGRVEEFRIVQTHNIKVLHNQFWRVMCECSGLTFIPCV